jgi:mannosyltransferase
VTDAAGAAVRSIEPGLAAPAAGTGVAEPEEHLGRTGWLWVAGIVAATALAMLPGIGVKSLWRDEGFSVSTSLRSWSSLFHLIVHDEANSALHSVALKAWSVFGTSEGVLRTLSALAALAAIPVLAALGTKLAGRKVGIVAALLLACHGSIFAYGQQVRGYAFTVLFAALASLFLAVDVRRPSNAALVGWVLASLALTYSNLAAATLIVSQLLTLFALPAERRLWKRRLVAGGVALALTLPVALLIMTHNEGGLFEFTIGTFWDVAMVMTGRSGVIGLLGVTVLVVIGARATLHVFRDGGSWLARWTHVLAILWVMGPFVMAAGASLVEPILSGRYMMLSVPGLALYGALGLVDLWSTYRVADAAGRAWRVVATAVIGLAALAGVVVWLQGHEVENWRGAAKYVFAEAQPGDQVLFANDSVRLFFEYYRKEGVAGTVGGGPPTAPTPAYPAEPWGEYQTGDHKYVSFTEQQLAEAAARADRLWIVVGRDHVNTGHVDEMLKQLPAEFKLAESRRFNGRVDVLLFDRQ